MRANFESRRIREGQRHSSSAAPSEWCSMKTPRRSITLEEEQQQLLDEWVRAHRTPQQVAKRCQIILLSAEGKSDEAIAKDLDINRHTCRLWRERFASCGVDCLWEVETGRGRKSQAGLAQRIIAATLHSKPSGQPIGPRARWPRSRECTPARWRESGRSTNSNLTGKRASNSHGTRSSSKSFSMWSGSISILPNTPSCSVSMKKVRFKRWIVLSPVYPLKRADAAPGPTTTSGTEQRPCLLRSTPPAVRSAANVIHVTAIRSSLNSCASLIANMSRISNYT